MQAGDLAALAIGTSLLAASGGFGAAALRIRGRGGFLLAALTIAAATIVLVSVSLSFVGLYTREAVLAGQLAVLAGVVAAWITTGRPHRPRPWLPAWPEAAALVRDNPAVAVLGAATVFALGVTAVLAVCVAPNNPDSMIYHLARIGFWLQHDSVLWFPGGSVLQLQNPPNAEILQGWTILLSSSDRFAQLVQWTALGGTGLGVYLGARILRFSVPAGLFAAFLFMTLPEPVLQASTTQNDLTVAFFAVGSAVFGVRAFSMRSPSDALIAALAFALGLGTKGTFLLILPTLVLIGAASIVRWRPPWRALLRGTAVFIAASAALGATVYVENAIHTGDPLGEIGDTQRGQGRPLPLNAVYMGWSFVDLPGLDDSWIVDGIETGAQDLVGQNAEKIASEQNGFPIEVDTLIHTDYTAYGPLVPAVLFPLLLIYALASRAPPDRRVTALAVLGYFIVLVIVIDANPYVMRYPIAAIAIGFILMARVERIAWLRAISAFVAVFMLVPTLLLNEQKPLGFSPTAWSFLGADRATQQAGSAGPRQRDALRRLDAAIPEDARIALVAGGNAWEYPYFGQHLTRYVHRVGGGPHSWRSMSKKQRHRRPEGEGAPLSDVDEVRSLMRERSLDAVAWADIVPPAGIPVEDLGTGNYLYPPSEQSTQDRSRPAGEAGSGRPAQASGEGR